MADTEHKQDAVNEVTNTPAEGKVPAPAPAPATDSKAECLCSEFTEAIKAHPLFHDGTPHFNTRWINHKGAAEVFYWRDILRSALIFVIFNFFFFLVCIAEYPVVTLGSYLSLALVGASVAYSKFLAMKGNPKNFIEERVKETDFGVREETLKQAVESAHKLLEASRKFAFRVFSASDKALTIATAGALLLVSQIAKLFSGFGLIYVTVLVLFIWPRLYEEKKELIDAQYAKISAQIKEKLEPLLAKIPGTKAKKE